MQIKILGKVPSYVTVEDFVAFLKLKKCPAEYCNSAFITEYKRWGEFEGVRWDIMICQSILETGRFTFAGSSVRPHNFNYAGIGATDSAPMPEQYRTQSEGIHAQAQILAIRGGKDIGAENMLSPRYKSLYNVVFDKMHFWENLAGTWASDKLYWDKIQSIAREYQVLTGNDLLVEVAADANAPIAQLEATVTWFEFNKYDNGNPSIMGYAGDKPVYEFIGKNKNDLIKFLECCRNANTFLVADTTKIIPELEHSMPTPDSNPNPINGSLEGLKVLIDAGHSKSRQGARGQAPDFPSEWEHNVLAAGILVTELKKHGADVEYLDPDPDNLTLMGQKARGKDLAIYVHHNAFNADGKDEGTGMYLHYKASSQCRKLASLMCDKVSKAIGSYNRGNTEAGFTVLSEAMGVGCPIAILPELYFIDDYGNVEVTRKRTTKAAYALVDAIIEFYKG